MIIKSISIIVATAKIMLFYPLALLLGSAVFRLMSILGVALIGSVYFPMFAMLFIAIVMLIDLES